MAKLLDCASFAWLFKRKKLLPQNIVKKKCTFQRVAIIIIILNPEVSDFRETL